MSDAVSTAGEVLHQQPGRTQYWAARYFALVS